MALSSAPLKIAAPRSPDGARHERSRAEAVALPAAARRVLPRALRECALTRAGGFCVLPDLCGQASWKAMRAEALAHWRSAGRCERSDSMEEWRGKGGAVRLATGKSGPALQAFARSRRTLEMLALAVGRPVVPLRGSQGSYSYYERAGDGLGIHRDTMGCDIAVVTVLRDGSSPLTLSGALVLYPTRWNEPLSAIRRRPLAGALTIKLAAGQSAVLCGGLVPHALLTVARGQRRIVSTLCYTIT